jgi:hypothetical protein
MSNMGELYIAKQNAIADSIKRLTFLIVWYKANGQIKTAFHYMKERRRVAGRNGIELPQV